MWIIIPHGTPLYISKCSVILYNTQNICSVIWVKGGKAGIRRTAMKVLMKPIKIIAWFDENGKPNPVRFNISLPDESSVTIRIDRVIKKHEEKLAGNRMLVFTCQSVINNIEKMYEIKYELSSCKWYLYKI